MRKVRCFKNRGNFQAELMCILLYYILIISSLSYIFKAAYIYYEG